MDPDIVKEKLDVESIKTPRYILYVVTCVSALCKHMSHCVTKVVT